jgi:TM2 domain-containing membrane protein YozV
MPDTFCSSCGAKVELAISDVCPNCGEKVKPSSAPAAGAPAPAVASGKNPILAAILSFVIPGLGQVYNGQIVKGIVIFVAFIIGIFLVVIPGVIVWLYGIYDAYTTAQKGG